MLHLLHFIFNTNSPFHFNVSWIVNISDEPGCRYIIPRRGYKFFQGQKINEKLSGPPMKNSMRDRARLFFLLKSTFKVIFVYFKRVFRLFFGN